MEEEPLSNGLFPSDHLIRLTDDLSQMKTNKFQESFKKGSKS